MPGQNPGMHDSTVTCAGAQVKIPITKMQDLGQGCGTSSGSARSARGVGSAACVSWRMCDVGHRLRSGVPAIVRFKERPMGDVAEGSWT
jgi:hypothetical protein